MTKLEAIDAMKDGQWVKHSYFLTEERVTMKSGKIETEDGCICEPNLFWILRTDDLWENGWEIFVPETSALAD